MGWDLRWFCDMDIEKRGCGFWWDFGDGLGRL